MAPQNSTYHCLLLLPSLPSDLSLISLKVAYGPALNHVLKQLAHVTANTAKDSDRVLTIAVADNGRSHSGYSESQRQYALMYRLTCNLMTDMSIDVWFGNDVDVRIALFHSTRRLQPDENAVGPDMRFGSLLDLAKSPYPWSHVYSVETEPGEALLREFMRAGRASTSTLRQDLLYTRVPRGLTVQKADNEPLPAEQQSVDSWNSHRSVAVGGTFDHLHAGHKLLLTMTALVLEPTSGLDASKRTYLTIGITGDDLLHNKKYREEVETWEQRQSSVQRFLLDFLSYLSPENSLESSESVKIDQGREVHNILRSGLHIKYKEIFDPFGPTITDPNITALVISAETRAGGKAVNDKRAEKTWQALEIFEVDVLDAKEGDGKQTENDFGSKISSTEIRSRIHQRKEKTDGTSQRG